MFKRKLPLNLPDGWVTRKVFGGAAGQMQYKARAGKAAKPVMRSQFSSMLKDLSTQRLAQKKMASASQPVPLPTGATPGPLHILSGLMGLFAATVLLLIRRRV